MRLLAPAPTWPLFVIGLLALAHSAHADPFDDLLTAQDVALEPPEDLLGQTDEARVSLPLERVVDARAALSAQVEARRRGQAPAVRMVAAHYRGRATADSLALTIDLDVALGRPGAWKTVPLLGEGAVLVGARIGETPVPVTRHEGYFVWQTRRSGPHRIQLDVRVPSGGKRGAIAFDFGIARTPVTRVECDFDQPDLTPRIAGAVDNTVTALPGGTRLDATLPPSLRINLVGPKAIGEAEARPAQIFVADQTLVAISDRVDVFMQLDHTVLYAPISTVRVQLPAGAQVVSASGPGAFRHRQAGDVLIIDTGAPVKEAYSVSVHLQMPLPDGDLTLALPRVEGAERQAGWIAVEVAGNRRLAERVAKGVHPVDVRELPASLRNAAITPILKAWRHDAPTFDLALSVERLEGVPVDHGAVDEVVAFSALSNQGTVLTEMRMLFYNQLRHRLAVRLPEGAEIRSAILDGAPIGASRDAEGRVLLPLSRSRSGDATLEVSIIIEQPAPAPGMFGRADFSLPTLDLPVRSVRWSVFLPKDQAWSQLRGQTAPQHRRGSLRWRKPAGAWDAEPPAVKQGGAPQIAGTVPVRINVPRTGHRLNFKQYWIGAGKPITAHAWHLKRWLINSGIFLGCLALLACLIVAPRRRWALLPAVGAASGVAYIAGPVPLYIVALLALALIAWRERWLQRVVPALRTGVTSGWARLRAWRPSRPASWRATAGRVALSAAMLYVGLNILELVGPAIDVVWP